MADAEEEWSDVVVQSVSFKGHGRTGDFEYMIKQGPYSRTLFLIFEKEADQEIIGSTRRTSRRRSGRR